MRNYNLFATRSQQTGPFLWSNPLRRRVF